MFKFDMTEDDLFTLQSAVENMRAAPDGEEQRARINEARWRLASRLEDMAKRADAARRATHPINARERGMIDIVDRLRFDAARCEATFSKGVATNIEEGVAEIERLRQLLE